MNVLDAAARAIYGQRAEAYGPPEEGGSFASIAVGWSEILGTEVTAHQVALCMIWLKVVREAHNCQPDNLVDIAGYAALAEVL